MACAMKPRPHRTHGFTVTELIVVVVVVAVLIGLVVWLSNTSSSATKAVSATVNGKWASPPSTIAAAPATATFTYMVQSTTAGGSPAPASGREIKFTLGPSTLKWGTGHIVSITDKNGAAVDVPQNVMSGTGATDAGGNIEVVVTLESKESANMVATDVKTGQDDPPIVFSAQ